MTSGGTSGERRAWGWVASLREGGTTPWSAWTGEAQARGRVLPGAQQLELLRRVNLAGRPTPELVRRVLGASAPGRGRPDLELVGAVDPGPFGPRPVDPADLPTDELVRVATSVLADDLVATALPEAPSARRPWRRRFRLVGDPWLADAARAELRARGRAAGGRGSVALVLATDLGTMLTHAWAHRVTGEGAPPWRAWLAEAVARDRVPPRADVLHALRAWDARVGRERVRLVLDPAALPGLTGTRRPLAAPPALSADGAELARRTAPVLGLLVRPERRTRVLREVLVPRVVALGGPPLVVSPEHAAWVAAQAERVHRTVRAAGYPVVGDPGALLPREHAGVAEPSEDGVLALAVRLLLAGPAESDSRDRRGDEDR
ncbi:hypothetical protein QWY28_04015 [Nocardioides sp. SOB77]|uniref:Uncharacterized protein n=1 Tax=Nocardioides oceani TaxID=3058369 RepID=A0ABT8FBN5_9ACTN|nr:hypothetical protein [Nocardioides oceani]MDN4172099.1 hypothetical protein [Nocardioides oceani]